jgi:hypothetical protein
MTSPPTDLHSKYPKTLVRQPALHAPKSNPHTAGRATVGHFAAVRNTVIN